MATRKHVNKIIQRFLALFLFFNKIIIPSPALTNNPANKEPKGREPSINNSASNKEEAQLGIKPIIEAYNGVKYLLAKTNDLKLTYPIAPSIKKPKAKLIIKT